MAKRPTSVRVRAYNVGFGDCFLLSIGYAAGDARHVLIDCGTTGKARHKPFATMKDLAQRIALDCEGKLHMVVATHRHQDHVSGFSDEGADGGPGKIIRDCKPDLVVQPWTEDPRIATDAVSSRPGTSAAKRFAAGLANMHAVSAAALRAAQSPRLGATVKAQLEFLGEDNLRNAGAVRNLMRMGKAGKAVYARHGTKLPIRDLLPGVTIDVLGPPDLTQTTAIKTQRDTDTSEFWHLAAKSLTTAHAPLMGKREGAVPAQARWFAHRLDRLQGDSLLQLVRSLDAAMNNTSLILLFTVRGKKLLFPGDAQIENWEYALTHPTHGARTRAKLAGVDFYKVGHHGSLNATPKTLLWENFAKRSTSTHAANRLQTVMSTLSGKHGHGSEGTEVPRKKLVAALEAQSKHVSTEGLRKADDGFHDVEIPLD
jgi:hypothetical protein